MTVPTSPPPAAARGRKPPVNPPTWVMILGACFAAVAVLFLMGLVFSEISGHPVPCGARMLVVFILATCMAAAAAFLTGTAAAKGKLPLVGDSSPVNFAATGGVGAFIIVMLLGYLLYTCKDESAAPPAHPPATTTTAASFDPRDFIMRLNLGTIAPPRRVEYEVLPNVLPDDKKDEFLELSEVALDDQHAVARVKLKLKNVLASPMPLELKPGFFAVDDQRESQPPLVHSQLPGGTVPPGESREIVLYFAPVHWTSKHGPSTAEVQVRGMEPIVRATWQVRLPVTAD